MFRIHVLDEVESTNIEVKRAIDAGEPEGLVVRAHRQLGGYGRQGRVWASPVGGLYFSMLLRPAAPMAELPTLALLAGLSVRRALVRFVYPEIIDGVQVKWPNDIVVSADVPGLSNETLQSRVSERRFLKLCGISSEVRGGAACIGIGVNVVAPSRPIDDSTAHEGKNAPVYLEEIADAARLCGDDPRSMVLAAVLDEFEPLYRRWSREGFAALAVEYAACESLRGSCVDIVDLSGGVSTSGMVEGIGADGCLLVRDRKSGSVVSVASGEAHIV